MTPNPKLISLGESIHDAMKKFAMARRAHRVSLVPYISHNLKGACVGASYLLAKEATNHGIASELQLGSFHAYVFHDGLIYDPTFTQYILEEHEEPGLTHPKVKVWQSGRIIPSLAHKYKSITHTTQESVDHYEIALGLDKELDGYQLQWISPTQAHISWSRDGITVNPMH